MIENGSLPPGRGMHYLTTDHLVEINGDEATMDAQFVAVESNTGVDSEHARQEVALAIDRLVYFAGWTDKYPQLFGSVNPVATSHFNFTTPEPTRTPM